jgi:hypothetical protein
MPDKPANRIEELLTSDVARELHTQQCVTVVSATGDSLNRTLETPKAAVVIAPKIEPAIGAQFQGPVSPV